VISLARDSSERNQSLQIDNLPAQFTINAKSETEISVMKRASLAACDVSKTAWCLFCNVKSSHAASQSNTKQLNCTKGT
jgi:hypothetical protein